VDELKRLPEDDSFSDDMRDDLYKASGCGDGSKERYIMAR
jgi:hypothetical protein